MAETKFIKAVAFGGYDRADVDKRLDFLYNLVYDLKNELNESKLLLKKYRSGSDEEKNFEAVLAAERAKITQVQVKNETLSERNKALKDELLSKEAENAELRELVKKLQDKLNEADTTIASLQESNTDAIGVLFVDAKKSHDKIIAKAQQEASELEDTAKKFAETFIADTNNRAAKIIYSAEKQAVDVLTDAKNQSEQIRVSSNNMRAVMYSEIRELSERAAELRKIILDFTDSNLSTLSTTVEILENTEKTLNQDGIPVFAVPKTILPQYPSEPVYQKTKSETDKKRSSELDKLQAMAEAIENSSNPPDKNEDSGNSAKQAEAASDNNNVSDNPAESLQNSDEKKGGGVSLDDLVKQAQSLETGAKKGGGVSLDDLMKQAQALES